MPSLNEVLLLGHLGRDAETASTPTGKTVTKFSIATTRRWKSGEERKEETDWHNIVAWDVYEKIQCELLKGALVMVKGRLQTRSYENKDGNKVYTTEVIANNVFYMRQASKDRPATTGAIVNPHGVEVDDSDVPF